MSTAAPTVLTTPSDEATQETVIGIGRLRARIGKNIAYLGAVIFLLIAVVALFSAFSSKSGSADRRRALVQSVICAVIAVAFVLVGRLGVWLAQKSTTYAELTGLGYF